MERPGLVGHVGVKRRKNWQRRAKGGRRLRSVAYYLTWRERDEHGAVERKLKRFGRTGEYPSRADIAEWRHEAALSAALHEEELTTSIRRPRRPGGELTVLLCHVLGNYELHITPHSARATVDRKLWIVSRFLAWLREHAPEMVSIDQITKSHVLPYREQLVARVSPSTAASMCTELDLWWAWLTEGGYVWRRGGNEIRFRTRELQALARGDQPHHTFISTEQLQAAIGAQRTRYKRAILTCLAGTGMRSGEFRGCLRCWWDTTERTIRIPKVGLETTKKHARDIPVGAYVAEYIDWLLSARLRVGETDVLFGEAWDRPLRVHSLGCWLRPHGLTPQSLRRWFSSTLVEMECPDRVRQALMGHTMNRRDAAYTQVPMRKKREWGDRISARLRP